MKTILLLMRKIKVKSILFFAFLNLCAFSNFAQHNWPFPSFILPHPITGTIGEYRTTGADHFHNGTDMTNGNNYKVYAIESGLLRVGGTGADINVGVSGVRDIIYVHVTKNPLLVIGTQVQAGALIGTMYTQRYIHLHLMINNSNILSGGISPYTDETDPIIHDFELHRNGLMLNHHPEAAHFTSEIIINNISYKKINNKLDIMANVEDPTPAGNHLAPYKISLCD